METFLSMNEDMATEATDELCIEVITDEYGVEYGKDGKKMQKSPQELDGTYLIKREQRLFVIMHLRVVHLCVVLLFLMASLALGHGHLLVALL